jgi:hypothetical protein
MSAAAVSGLLLMVVALPRFDALILVHKTCKGSAQEDMQSVLQKSQPARLVTVSCQAKNTLRANTTAINAFSSWLVGTKNNSNPPVDLLKNDFLQLLAEFVLVVSCMCTISAFANAAGLICTWRQ